MTTFAVIIPCYNAEHHLAETLDSVLAQTFTDWQAILVDDGSTDSTSDIIDTYIAKDSRFSTTRQSNCGPSAARNRAARLPKETPFLAFLDSDDLWVPEKLALSLHAFWNPCKPDAVYGKVNFFTGDPRNHKTISTVPEGRLRLGKILGENPVCTLSNLCIRRGVFLGKCGFDETLTHSEDLEFLIRIVSQRVHIESIDKLLVHYRTSASGLSADLDEMHAGWQRAAASAYRSGTILTPAEYDHAEAIHLRYLARRALRTNSSPLVATKLALCGLCKSPSAFLSDPYRGWMTLLACLIAPILPSAIRKSAFSE